MSTAAVTSAPATSDAVPPGLVATTFRTDQRVPHPREAVWSWLCDPATFVDGQVWPWRVEFVDPEHGVPAGFTPGVLTNHHGPLMNFAGVIGEVRAPEYRDLPYSYGAFFVGPRICRPTRLQFWLEEDGPGATTVTIQVDAQVRRGLVRASQAVQEWFWGRFAGWAARAISQR